MLQVDDPPSGGLGGSSDREVSILSASSLEFPQNSGSGLKLTHTCGLMRSPYRAHL